MLAATLPGCALLRRRPDPSRPVSRVAPPGDVVENWRALGKLGVRSGEQVFSAAFDWRQTRERFQLRLAGPLGQGALQLTGGSSVVELLTASGKRRTAPSVEALLDRELGMKLPASSLRHWITGRVRPVVPVDEWALDEHGRLTSLSQQGWTLEYRYPEESGRGSLPRRITLRSNDLVLRVVIRDWQTG